MRVAALLLATISVTTSGCWWRLLNLERDEGKSTFRDQESGFSVRKGVVIRRGESFDSDFDRMIASSHDRGEKGDLHPAVVEYVFGQPETPLARYYDAALAQPHPTKRMAADLAQLADVARDLASPPAGRHYARALGRRLAEYVRKAMSHDGKATLWWGVAVDFDSRQIKRDFERDGSLLRTTLFRYESSQMVLIYSSDTGKIYAWDLSFVPGAFDHAATLSVAQVASNALPLHRTEAPR